MDNTTVLLNFAAWTPGGVAIRGDDPVLVLVSHPLPSGTYEVHVRVRDRYGPPAPGHLVVKGPDVGSVAYLLDDSGRATLGPLPPVQHELFYGATPAEERVAVTFPAFALPVPAAVASVHGPSLQAPLPHRIKLPIGELEAMAETTAEGVGVTVTSTGPFDEGTLAVVVVTWQPTGETSRLLVPLRPGRRRSESYGLVDVQRPQGAETAQLRLEADTIAPAQLGAASLRLLEPSIAAIPRPYRHSYESWQVIADAPTTPAGVASHIRDALPPPLASAANAKCVTPVYRLARCPGSARPTATSS